MRIAHSLLALLALSTAACDQEAATPKQQAPAERPVEVQAKKAPAAPAPKPLPPPPPPRPKGEIGPGKIVVSDDLSTPEGMRLNAFVDKLLSPETRRKKIDQYKRNLVRDKKPTARELEMARALAAHCQASGTPDFTPCIAVREILAFK